MKESIYVICRVEVNIGSSVETPKLQSWLQQLEMKVQKYERRVIVITCEIYAFLI
jgi:hypothetical protein